MSKRYERRTEPARDVDYFVERKCDLCGTVSKRTEWTDGSTYEINETEVTVTVRSKEGFSTSDGGSGTKFEVDICPKCFKDKLLPMLRVLGADIKEQQWDW